VVVATLSLPAPKGPGQARRSLLRGVKLDEGMCPIVTLHCIDCGNLESYAPNA